MRAIARKGLYSKHQVFGADAMYQINLQDAETQLAQLIEQAADGEEVIITRNDGAAFKIVPIVDRVAVPKFGSARERIKISDDFDDPLEGFEEYTP